MSQYRCIICGSEIEPLPGSNIAVCPNCETRQEIQGYITTPQQHSAQPATDKRKSKKGFIGGIVIGMIIMLCIIFAVIGVSYLVNGNRETFDKPETGYKNDEIIGEYLEFGSYEQDGNESNGAEPIEWLVLDKEGDRILVISKYALDCKPYNEEYEDITWEDCTLREWLNDDFINHAFTQTEIKRIPTVTVSSDENPEYDTYPGNNTKDKVFLLSIDEVNEYFGSDSERKCEPTEYATENGAWQSDDGNCEWRLRSPRCISYYAAYVNDNGSAFENSIVHRGDAAVRPALWINLE